MSAAIIETDPPSFSDWAALLQLLRGAFSFMDGRIDPPSSLVSMTADDLRSKARSEHLITARIDGRLVGCAFADVRPGCVYVGKLAVSQSARQRGVARQMLEAAESIARQHGRDLLELQTRVELVENQAAFAALGFRVVAQTAHPGYSRPTSVTMQRSVGLR